MTVRQNSNLRVVLLSEVFCRNMGYLENMLPKSLARLGVEVHVLATDLPPGYRQKSPADLYEGFLQSWQPGTAQTSDGFTLHILGHKQVLGHVRIAGLREKLRELSPAIVQTMTPIGWIALDAACSKLSRGYKLFTGCHHHASVFPLASRTAPIWSAARLRCLAVRTLPGRLVSLATEKCYAITADCAGVASRFFGVPRCKIEISPLGVDTEIFHRARGTREVVNQAALRRKLGFSDSDIVCIYTGRFTKDKNPLLLANAIAQLQAAGKSFRGLFLGNGPQAAEIQKCPGNVTHPFEPVHELGVFFRAADIGVWPAQESLSMLDAAACGLPIIVNHTMSAPERISGNGLTYRLNDLDDLIRALLDLQNSLRRREMGAIGAERMAREFSWDSIALRRLSDYETALHSRSCAPESSLRGRSFERTS